MSNDTDKKSFEGLGIVPGFLARINEIGFTKPTPIQCKAIPIANSGEDLVGIAQTGSGKTLSFAIPMIQLIALKNKKGLVLVPTRELAVQVVEEFRKIAGTSGFQVALVIGGANPRPQIKQLKAQPHVIVATPGRLIDHMDRGVVSFEDLGMLVLDEADRMLDMGFAPQLKKIIASLPKDRQTMLFSATMPDKIAKMAHQYMKEPLRVEIARPGTAAANIDQEVFIVPRDEKIELLKRLLFEYKGSVLVFTRTKHGAKNIARKVRDMGYTADELHSNRSQGQRQKALKGFANGKYKVLVATDIAARGIDVDYLELVINYDLPEQIEDYTHRIGRTGRAGREGKAISFAVPEQKGDIAQIQHLINMVLPIKSPCGKELDSIKPSARAKRLKQQRGGGGGRRGGGGRKRNYRRRR